jgi:hypothetical protein
VVLLTVILKIYTTPALDNPVLIEGLPGIGNVGKVVVEYMIEKLRAKKFAELYSCHFPYHVFVNEDDTIELPKNEFYYWKRANRKQRDLIILTGDMQSITPEGHYEIVNKIIDFVQQLGTTELYTIGGFGIQRLPSKEPGVVCAVTHKEIKRKLQRSNVEFSGGQKVGFIIGASGLLLGIGKIRGLKGACFMGETIGTQPFFTDSKSAKAVLTVLNNLLKLDIDMEEIEEMTSVMEKAIARAKDIQRKIGDELTKGAKPEDLRYIG